MSNKEALGPFDIALLEGRLDSLKADLSYLKDVQASKLSHETRLYGIREQKKFPCNTDESTQVILDEGERALLKSIENTTLLSEKLRDKILKALGRM